MTSLNDETALVTGSARGIGRAIAERSAGLMKTETYRPGVPCWAELTSDDPAAARAFYRALLGWRFTDIDAANADGGVICALGDSPVGVIEPAGDGQPSSWTSYLFRRVMRRAPRRPVPRRRRGLRS